MKLRNILFVTVATKKVKVYKNHYKCLISEVRVLKMVIEKKLIIFE